jgi:hypothetical protein
MDISSHYRSKAERVHRALTSAETGELEKSARLVNAESLQTNQEGANDNAKTDLKQGQGVGIAILARTWWLYL